MFITELSIKRPAVSWVMSLILIVFGLFVFWKLPVRELPDGIQPPVVQVQVDYKSASASIIDQEGATAAAIFRALYFPKRELDSSRFSHLRVRVGAV